MAKWKQWRCLEPECGAHGEQPTKNLAETAWRAHWVAAHQTVPWMDDDTGPP